MIAVNEAESLARDPVKPDSRTVLVADPDLRKRPVFVYFCFD
jgi:hypothetical protein